MLRRLRCTDLHRKYWKKDKRMHLVLVGTTLKVLLLQIGEGLKSDQQISLTAKKIIKTRVKSITSNFQSSKKVKIFTAWRASFWFFLLCLSSQRLCQRWWNLNSRSCTDAELQHFHRWSIQPRFDTLFISDAKTAVCGLHRLYSTLFTPFRRSCWCIISLTDGRPLHVSSVSQLQTVLSVKNVFFHSVHTELFFFFAQTIYSVASNNTFMKYLSIFKNQHSLHFFEKWRSH